MPVKEVENSPIPVPKPLLYDDSSMLVEGVYPKNIFKAVVEWGCSQWYSIGLTLLDGNDAKVTAYSKDMAECGQKLQAIITKTQAHIGPKRTAEELLQACKDAPMPIYYAVIQEAKRIQRESEKST
jgi:hypothetical protein